MSNYPGAAGRCDVGRVRAMNQDQIYCSVEPVGKLPNLFVVADGMGGHKAGDLASAEALRYFIEYIEDHSDQDQSVPRLMHNALEMANRYVYYLSKESMDYRGMGTTFVAACVSGETLYCVNVGDSRLYVLTQADEAGNCELVQVTEDHSVVEMLVRQGLITEEEARVHPKKNMITRAIGIDESVEIDDFELGVMGIQKGLLCSDGLSNMLTNQEIKGILSENLSADEAARKLIEEANAHGGKDNISAVVLDFSGEVEEHA